jgi:hypothetical protein
MPAAVITQYRQRISGEGDTATVMLTVTEDRVRIGWCQWYRWADYPAEVPRSMLAAARRGSTSRSMTICLRRR